ncbi:MAG: MFS transporter [Candidatus Thermoplasmatota archaeon]|nr:MFS transporter [Candidatus Thermoplasmatota archaeon]
MKTGSQVLRLGKKHRWLILLLLVLSILVGYLARMSVSIALPFVSQDYGWTTAEKGTLGGILMGIFLVSYGFSNIFFSPFIDIYGPKKMLTIALATWSGALVLGAYFGQIYWVFLLSRVLLGLGQGVLFPCASKVTGAWFSPEERGRANSLYMSGGPIGVMLAPLIMTPIILGTSWEMSFYFVAALGFALALPVFLLIEGTPSDEYPKEKRSSPDIKGDLKELISDRQFQLLLFGFTALTTVWWGMSLWIPTYLVEARGLPIDEMSFGASFPYVGAILGMYLGSWISDKTGQRRWIIILALLMNAALLFALTILEIQSLTVAIILLFFAFFGGQMAPPLCFTVLQSKVSGKTLGSATGIMNGLGNGIGVLGPITVGLVVAFTGSYDLGLLSLALISILGILLFYRYEG